MPETSGSDATTSPTGRPTGSTTRDELTSLVRPPSTEDGPVFAAVWHDVAGRASA